jgi:hypothetical protein
MPDRLERRGAPTAKSVTSSVGLFGGVVVAVLLVVPRVEAQAWNYPNFQQSHLVSREFNFAIADGGNAGSSFVVQWREQIGGAEGLVIDGGLATPQNQGGATIGFFGGQFDYQFVPQTDSQQVELLGTLGANYAFGNGSYLRFPAGVSVGHRFPLGGSLAVTPYLTPRLALESCTGCGNDGSGRTALGIGFGLGANLEITQQIAIRFDTSFGFSSIFASDNAFGISLAWSPMGLRK